MYLRTSPGRSGGVQQEAETNNSERDAGEEATGKKLSFLNKMRMFEKLSAFSHDS